MKTINKKLKEYIEKEIFPVYDKNEPGHGIKHIEYVIRRSLNFASQFENINLDMLYTVAAFHDIAHHIDKDNHETLSAKLFYENEKMKEFFTDKQRKIIKEAIEDHRASLEYVPRNDYGKIVSSADRNVSIDATLKRNYSYSLKHYPNLSIEQIIEESYNHISQKFGEGGYAKMYCDDEEYEHFKEDVKELLKDKEKFKNRYIKVNNISIV